MMNSAYLHMLVTEHDKIYISINAFSEISNSHM